MSIRDLTPLNRGRKSSLSEGDYHTDYALYERMGRLFDDVVTHFGVTPFGQRFQGSAFLLPRIDVLERDKEYCVTAELPGVDDEDVKVTLSERTLTITGEKKSETAKEGDHFLRAERDYGSFTRSVSLPSDINEEAIKATFNKGVLTVAVAKNPAKKAASKRIDVKKAA